MSITKELFGKLSDGREAYIYTLKNDNGMTVKLSEYGAAIVQLFAPDRNGTFADVVCGYDNLSSYEFGDGAHGSVVGRWANRIAKGRFTLDGKEYSLLINNGANHLHGGKLSFIKALWRSEAVDKDEPAVIFTHFSPDGEEGYPGNMNVTVTYTLTKDNALSIDYKATSDKRTVINLTNHCYFNIAGHDAGTLDDQTIRIFAPCFQEVDAALIPTGNQPATQSVFAGLEEGVGFRTVFDSGVEPDHNFLIAERPDGICRKAAEVTSAKTGITLTVSGDGCGVQWYACGGLSAAAVGKGAFIGAVAVTDGNFVKLIEKYII